MDCLSILILVSGFGTTSSEVNFCQQWKANIIVAGKHFRYSRFLRMTTWRQMPKLRLRPAISRSVPGKLSRTRLRSICSDAVSAQLLFSPRARYAPRFSFSSVPPSEGGSPGVVWSRCPTLAAFWPASLAPGPEGLPQRGPTEGPGRRARLPPCFHERDAARPGVRHRQKSALVIRQTRQNPSGSKVFATARQSRRQSAIAYNRTLWLHRIPA